VNKPKVNLHKILASKLRNRSLKFFLTGLIGFIFLSLLANLTFIAPLNAKKPIDGILVLGGSIRREIHAATIASDYPGVPILISQGSQDPCILILFQRFGVKLDRVWLEKCAHTTFSNFLFSVPILKGWGVHKVKVITSASHLPRAEWLAKIQLLSRGIAVEMDIPHEKGIPGNTESKSKTALDVTRSLIWAVVSQVISPPCWEVVNLKDVDLQSWQDQGFRCEYQGGIH
jgi:uncharacterized SAM-binding protein YcdF (DUF218 family)